MTTATKTATLNIPGTFETMTTGCLASTTARDVTGALWRCSFSLERRWEVTRDGIGAATFKMANGEDFVRSSKDIIIAYLRSARFTGLAA